MQPEPFATTGAGPRRILVRFDPAEDALRYVLFVTLCFIPFFIPFLFGASREERYILIGGIAFFLCIYMLERLRPGPILHQIAALPMTCGGPVFFLGIFLSLQTSGKMTPLLAAVAALSGVGSILINIMIIRRLTPEDCVKAAVNKGMPALNKRGVSITPPWTSGTFVTFIQWEYYLITAIRVLMIACWVYGALLQGPYMYSTIGIRERWPMAMGMMGFPMSFFFTRFWQIPFLWYCQQNPEPLLQKARETEAREKREAEQEAESERKQRRAEKKKARRHDS